MNNLADRLIQNYVAKPNKICLADKLRSVTYSELYESVKSFKDFLSTKGIKKGDKVLVLVPMSIELYIALLTCWSMGAIVCFMDSGFIQNNINKSSFDDIDSVIGITKYLLYSNINTNLRNLKIKVDSNNIKIEKSSFLYGIHDIDNSKVKDEEYLKIEEVEKDFPAIYTYTSGTTGNPKIVVRTHEFLLNQADILSRVLAYDDFDKELSSVPIFTLSNINFGIETHITNCNYSSLAKSNPIKIVNQILKGKINRIMAAPGLLNVIVNYCLKNRIRLDSINKIFTGGGAIFLDYIYRIKKVFPKAKIYTLYGSSEAEPIAIADVTKVDESIINQTLSGNGIFAGRIVGVEDIRIIKPTVEDLESVSKVEFDNLQENVGEIVVTGKNVLKGYLNGIGDKQNKINVEGTIYHRTGDMGRLDDEGNLWLYGRIKEPYLNIEASIHAKYDILKSACFKHNGKLYLVFEKKEKIEEDKVLEIVNKFGTVDGIKHIKEIPVDKRHNAKVDYKQLEKLIS